jgi:peroxiredoxin Q/BCP
VSFDTREENERFAAKNDFPFPLLSDNDRSIALAYGAATSAKDEYPNRIAYLIDEQGKIAEAHPRVDARAYPAEQLARLEAAG